MIYDQWVAGLDVSRKFDVFKSLNVAFGIEGRREGFQIQAGQLESYEPVPPNLGTVFPNATPGAQGFVGFSPANAIDAHRNNGSAYIDVEAQVTDKLLIGLAGRGETYSDFGQTATGKASIRYDFTPWFALRGTVSTGFRAPSLQQQYFTSVSSVVQTVTDPNTGLPTSENYGIDAQYNLIEIVSGKSVMTGTTFSRLSYDMPGSYQRFSRNRAVRDAEDRAANEIAENITTRLAAFFTAGT